LLPVAQTQLDQDGSQSDGADDYDRQRAEERALAGEKDNYCQDAAEQAGSDYGPAARFERGVYAVILDSAGEDTNRNPGGFVLFALLTAVPMHRDPSLRLKNGCVRDDAGENVGIGL